MTRRDEVDFDNVLDLLGYSGDDSEFISIGWQPVGRGFRSVVRNPTGALRFVAGLPESDHDSRSDIWFSVNSLRAGIEDGKRGTERDVVWWRALYGDLDVKPGAFKSIDAALACVGTVSGMLGTRPSVIICSGHGIQPTWPVEDGALDTPEKLQQAAVLSRRFGRLLATVAWRDHKAAVDTVSDLSRVLRVPQTFNFKDPRHIVEVYAVADTGAPVTVDAIEEFLDDWGEQLDVPALDSDIPVSGEVISAPGGWRFGESDCNYVAAMVQAWGKESDRPKAGRHQWAMDRAVRLACAHRLGCLTEDGLKAALEHLEKRLAHWCQVVGVPRGLHPGEIDGAYRWGVTKAATLTDMRARGELGGHSHKKDLTEEQAVAAGLCLPEEFWGCESLKRVRQIAWHYQLPPDAVFNTAMALLSSCMPPGVRVNTGILKPVPLHHFASVTGPTGLGKSTLIEVGKECVTVELPGRQAGQYPCGIRIPDGRNTVENDSVVFPYEWPLGSAAGICESYMGQEYYGEPDKKGDRRTRRAQVRSNVLLSTDEGEDYVKACLDPRSTVGEVTRAMWSGRLAGQGNASAETRRILRGGSYTLAMLVGFHEESLADFQRASQLKKGTPQRFVHAWSVSPDIPKTKPVHPGTLVVSTPTIDITVCAEVTELLDEDHHAKVTGAVKVPQLQSQRGGVLARMAGLLTVLDKRREISMPDWRRAEMWFATSLRIAEHCKAKQQVSESADKERDRMRDLTSSIREEEMRRTPHGKEAARILSVLAGRGGEWVKYSGEDGLRARFQGKKRKDADGGVDWLSDNDDRVEKRTEGRTVWLRLMGNE